MKNLLKEPLLHFLLLGAGLFLLFDLSSPHSGSADTKQEIVVSQGRIQTLQATYEKVWRRPPNEQELQGLIHEYVRDEVFYREAQAMGLDQNDTIVRRRMRQKLEFLAGELGGGVEPTDEELETFLAKHPDRFREENRYTFQQVYLNVNTREAALEADANALLIALRNGADATLAGDPLRVPQRFDHVPDSEVARTMGNPFLQELKRLPVGDWQGPIVSGFGVHLVKVSDRSEGRVPDLKEIRRKVSHEWSAQHRKENMETFYQALRQRYIVTIQPSPGEQIPSTEIALNE
jgi:hypothetical protein